MEVLLDTNFLVLPFTKKVDIYQLLLEYLDEPYKLIVLKPCLEELKKINPAAVALAVEKTKIVPAEGFADNAILKYSEGRKVLVCTQDYRLRQKLSREEDTSCHV